jgi:hypothetical protein
VCLALQVFPAPIQGVAVQGVTTRKLEKAEVIGRKLLRQSQAGVAHVRL